MCAECGHNPCVTRCPNNHDVFGKCDYCGDEIETGEEIYQLEDIGKIFHRDCAECMNFREVAEVFGYFCKLKLAYSEKEL